MSAVFKIFLSMSCSGGLLILALLLGKKLVRDRISRQWQYYIWLAVILRLLLPFGPESSLMGALYRTVGQETAAPMGEEVRVDAPEADWEWDGEDAGKDAEPEPLRDVGVLAREYVWLIWLAGALGLLVRKITAYQGFVRYVKAGGTPVEDVEILNRLALIAEEMSVRGPVELYVNPLASSPLLIGVWRPCIVLPCAEVPEKDFRYIVLHELTHFRRGDLFYKWLVQMTVCLHWFNPLVHLMGREITKACEFSCDEAVLVKTGGAREYGETLLDAMAAVGKYRESPGAVTLSENKRILKERLDAIMSFKRKSTVVRILTGMLTVCVVLGAAFVGVYPAAAGDWTADRPAAVRADAAGKEKSDAQGRDYAALAERYYEAGSLPLFQIAFSRLDGKAQGEWLDRLYEDGDIVFFSAVADRMDEETLEIWLDRALEDGDWAFQSMLFDRLDRDEEFDELEEKRDKEWEEKQKAEYGAVGVTMDGKDYFFKGKLVNIFLDLRPNKSFYTLNLNPKGTVNIKIVRDEDNAVTGVEYLTEAEVTELLEDMRDDESEEVVLPVKLKSVAAGETVFLGEYTLSEGDRICYDILAETGNRMKVFFARGGRKDVAYWSVNNRRQPGEELECAADFTVEAPAKPGTYRLYLQAPDGALGNVQGEVSFELQERN